MGTQIPSSWWILPYLWELTILFTKKKPTNFHKIYAIVYKTWYYKFLIFIPYAQTNKCTKITSPFPIFLITGITNLNLSAISHTTFFRTKHALNSSCLVNSNHAKSGASQNGSKSGNIRGKQNLRYVHLTSSGKQRWIKHKLKMKLAAVQFKYKLEEIMTKRFTTKSINSPSFSINNPASIFPKGRFYF